MKNLIVDPVHEKYVQTPNGVRIDGRQDFYNTTPDGRKHWIKTYTWMRYTPFKNLDDVDQK